MSSTALLQPSGRLPAYATFRADAARGRVERSARKRALAASAAALALAGGAFWATMVALPPKSEASLFSFPENVHCARVGQSLAPWFETEQRRVARTGAHRFADFEEMLTTFQDAQQQCAAGEAEDAVSDFQDLANQIATLEEQRSWRAD